MYELLVPSAAGIEGVVKLQLKRLGYGDCKADNGRTSVFGDFYTIARLNMFLRSGERVLLVVGKFPCVTFDELYEGVYALPWEQFLTSHSLVNVNCKTVKSQLFAYSAIQKISKKAIVDKMLSRSHKEMAEDGARCIVEVNINNDFAVVTIDTSGDGLHKRGYRDLAYTAPIKETTASALIDLSVMRRDKQFVDLFCGSGTLPIEVAMRECCIAPGLQRTFDYCDWECVPKDCYEKSVVEAKDSIKLLPNLDIRGYDINPEAISISRRHAKRAGVDFVKFEVADMREFKSVMPYGVMISNVPYGERLSDEQEVLPLYKDLGKLYKTLPDWNFYILTAQLDFEKYFGKWASKKRKLYNANIECCYYAFNGNPPPKSNNFTKDTID